MDTTHTLPENVWHAIQRARIAEKVHKPTLGVNIINFERIHMGPLESLRPQEAIVH